MTTAFSASSRKSTPAGCLVPFGLIFMAAGLWVCRLAWSTILTKVSEVRKWTETPCQVTRWESGIDTKNGDVFKAAPRIAYQYEAAGRTLTGTTYDAAKSTTLTLNSLEEEGVAARRGPAVCYVNPANPEQASYLRPSYTTGGAVLAFGAVFACVGGAMALTGVLGLARRLVGGSPAARGPAKGCAGGIVAPFVFLAFAGAGFAVWRMDLYNQPDWDAIGVRMVEVPAKVLASGVSRHTSSGRNSSTTYKAKVAFEYEFDGRTWRSGWLDFDQGSTYNGNSTKAHEAAARHPAGSSARAWVDPLAPWQAVLEKTGGNRWGLWKLPIIFGGVGVLGLLGWLLKMRAMGAAILAMVRRPGGGAGR